MNTVIFGDCRDSMAALIGQGVRVQTCVTSPPYFGLRDYGHPGQLGLENTPAEYVANLVEVFRLVRDLLADEGTLWLNLGDSYARNPGKGGSGPGGNNIAYSDTYVAAQASKDGSSDGAVGRADRPGTRAKGDGLKEKDLIGIPWRVAFALQQPHRNWQIKTEAMRAWVGGIVDGEGCITIMETKSSHSESLSYPPIIQVRMCDLEPLDRLVQVVGSSYGKPQHSPSHKAANQRPSYQWKVVSEQAANVIAEIYPFLTCKRKQAIVAWNHQLFRTARGNQARARGDIEKEQFCKTLINALNQRQPVDIPSWMVEPQITYEPGWYLRQDLIWAKPNPMPESVTDRCTKSHEYIFLLSKSARYFYDHEAIKEAAAPSSLKRWAQDVDAQIGSERAVGKTNGNMKAVGGRSARDTFKRENSKRGAPIVGQAAGTHRADREDDQWDIETRNKRSVWTVATTPYKGAHFATFPPKLIEPCILAGSRPGDIVFDPFMGSGTTGQVAQALGRNWLGCELNPAYSPLQNERTMQSGLVLA